MLQKDESKANCYFYLGCNYLGLQDYEKAKECFERYIFMEPYGVYSYEARELRDILKSQEFYAETEIDVINPAKEKLYRMANKGKNYLDAGDYKKAIRCLENAVSKDPSLVFAKNNLALAYFCIGELDKAIDICNEVLKDYPYNVHANCNISIFLQEKGCSEESEKHLDTLLGMQTKDPEETHKIAVTLCELKKHKEANRLLKKLLIYKPYDIKILHYIAVSYFNMQMYNDALTYWDKIDKIVPHNTISSFYKRLARAIMKKEREFREIPYHFQVPYEEVIYRIKKINDLLKLPERALRQRWETGDELMALLGWGLGLNDISIKKAILNVVASFGDQKTERFLREFLLKKNVEDELKKEAVALLKQMKAREPYIAYINNTVVEIWVDILEKVSSGEIPRIYYDVLEIATQKMKDRYEDGYELKIREMWEKFIRAAQAKRLPRIRKAEAWAAALELYFCHKSGIDVNMKRIAEFYEAAYSTVYNNWHYIFYTILEEKYGVSILK